MSIKKLFTLSLFTLSVAGLVACDKGSGTSPKDDESSSSVASFRSSSSLSEDRADISYPREIEIGDTMQINVAFCEKSCEDTTDRDPSETYIEIDDTTIPMYLGNFPKGSRIKVYARANNLDNAQIRIKSEKGDSLRAVTAIPKKAQSKDSVYAFYFAPNFGSDSTKVFRDSNEFIVFNEGHYYLELSGEFDDESTLRLKTVVDSSYYSYTGDSKSISMGMTDTIRGVILINDTLNVVSIDFSANEGYSINLTSFGKNITKMELKEDKETLRTFAGSVDTLLVPTDSVDWTLDLTTEGSSFFFLTGPFAFFEVNSKSRALEKGEYFTHPDSIKMPGEYLISTRPKDDPEKSIYKYNLRQEQYVWLGNFKKGDSIRVEHKISNYSDDNQVSPVTIEIIDKNQKAHATVSSVYGGGLEITKDMPEGPYYLHYIRLNSNPLDQVADSMRYVLQFRTLLQQIGSVENMEFYNHETENSVKIISNSVGDTIRFGRLNQMFSMDANTEKGWDDVGYDVRWYVPCSDLNIINSNYKVSSCETNGTEQLISSNYLIVKDAVGKTASLIAESVADPSMRDTLSILVIAKSSEE
ncbi:MAG: hypothetical protein MJY85_04395 [Fibrobacter sp.]|nr:hypothetical protein [Fibrobacter sp.]